jgi:hypothetical protein
MKTLTILLLFSLLFFNTGSLNGLVHKTNTISGELLGNFMDDYGIRYAVTDSLWIQYPSSKYHILKWNEKEQYIIARNDDKNPDDKGLYTRIDYMQFANMEPFLWGFCLSAFNAKTDSLAEATGHAGRDNPRKGCNGFPFSRMKRIK